jgi:hypothetical protein
MPPFDYSSSRPDPAEASLLRAVLGPARPGTTTLRLASRNYRRSRRRAMLKRSLIVAALVGSACGSAFVRANTPVGVAEAKRVSPAIIDLVTTGSIGGVR